MGLKLGGSAQKQQSVQDQYSKQQADTTRDSTTSATSNSALSSLQKSLNQTDAASTLGTTGTTTATFGDEGNRILQYLMNSGAGSAETGANAAATYGDLSRGGGVNPATEQIIARSNQEADRTFANRLAQTRAQGYRGGTGANVYRQDKLAADFTNAQAKENANLRYGAFNDANTNRLAGASGLASMSGAQQGLGAQILSLLRGQTQTGTQVGTQTGTQTGTQQTDTSQQTTSEQTTREILKALQELVAKTSGTQSGTSGSAEWKPFG